MKIKSLFDTNPYLRDPEQYVKALILNVGSSAAIEIGRISPSIAKALNEKSRVLKSGQSHASSERSH